MTVVARIDDDTPCQSTAVTPKSVSELCERAQLLSCADLLMLGAESFPGRFAVVSSFAAESVVILHQLASVDPSIPVIFLNTGKLFGETLRYRDRLQQELGLMDIRAVGPSPMDQNRSDPDGTLWTRNRDACCHFRKVMPLQRALTGFDAYVTGRKRFQTAARATLEKIELVGGKVRFNPLVDWSQDDLTCYIEEHRLPKHPLVDDGYLSIGCIPCTGRVRPGEAYRAGRWPGFQKDECGIHTGMDGDGI
jgi:phosphoadenosine phosphosulfate reductase